MPTTILPCHCTSPFQDHTYGLGKRVCNLCKHGTKVNDAARCTVCLTVHPIKTAQEVKEE